MKKYQYKIEGLDCANCANKIQVELEKNNKLNNVVVNFGMEKLSYETDEMNKEEIEKIIKKIEPEVTLMEIGKITKEKKNSNTIFQIGRLILGIGIALVGIYANLPTIFAVILTILGYGILLYRTIKNSVKILIKSKSIDENFLITISSIGAYLVGKNMEGLMVITLYEIGKILEEKAINKTRKSITELMDIKPEYANLEINGELKKVLPSEVHIKDLVVIKKGEKIPIDGIVIEGSGSLDTASLTGESKLREVNKKDEVLSGSILINGLLKVEVTREYEQSTVNKILELVENATDKKAKTETFVNKAARIYTPIVFIIAIIVAVFLPLISNVQYFSSDGSIYRALIFLVISCPCAIAISIPLCYFSGIGKASKEGILIKGSDYLDGLKDIKEIVFDKTGTLTNGEFKIDKIEVYASEYSEEEILNYVALGESYSNHPIAKSILKNISNKIEKEKVENFKEIEGKGLSFEFEGKEVLIGNSELVGIKEEKTQATIIYVKINDTIAGKIELKDKPKNGVKATINKLNQNKIITKMFTGDNRQIAQSIAAEIGIKEVKSEMLPQDKYNELQNIIKSYKGSKSKVAFVGDGINDSPVLAVSDIGISMGGVGSESAIEASDVVIMTDSIDKISESIDISKKTNRIIKQNLVFAIGVKILILILSVFGIADMWQAVFADVGVTLITIVNTLKILK